MHNDHDIDDAIDRAVRDMMSVEPRAGLSGRVFGRLERRDGTSWLAFPRLAAAAALLLALAIGALMFRPGQAPNQETTVTTTQVPAPPQSTTAPLSPTAETPAASEQPDPRVDSAGVPERGRVAATDVGDVTTFSPTTRPGATPVDAADARPIVITPITIEPIVIAPIVIEPMIRRR